jgi:3-oxoacyl-[acyl-carrier protein] reductase
VALVTGVGRRAGIGAAVARALTEAGAAVFLTAHPPYDAAMPWKAEPGETAVIAAELRAAGALAAWAPADLSDPAAPAALFDAAEAALGPVDILVNNAAYSVRADLSATTPELLDAHYTVNIRGTTLLCAEFARRHNGARPGGRIVNLTSGQGLHPMPAELPYVLTKAAVEALTVNLAPALAPLGITVNAVDPGPTDTGWMTEEFRRELVMASPRGRVGTPEDAARLVLFLASDAAEWVTGQIMRSRGGL